MKWFKRSIISIYRRPGKSLLLFVVVWAMFSLLAGSLSILATADDIKAEIKRGLGAVATITVKEDRLSEEKYDEVFAAYIDAVETLCDNEYVDYGEYRLSANGSIYSEDVNVDFPITILGTNIPESEQFRNKTFTLTSQDNNRNFTLDELESGAKVALVNINLATYQPTPDEIFSTGLSAIGNVVKVKINLPYLVREINERIKFYHDTSYEFEVKIIGTFADNKANEQSIIIPNQTLIEMMREASIQAQADGFNVNIMDQYPSIEYAGFKLKDNEHLTQFDTEAEVLLANLPKSFDYESSGTSYERNAGPIENLDMIAQIIFMASIVASVLILGLIIVYLISDRKKEVGIYMSLGEKNTHLISQILLEIILVSTLAIAAASISGFYLGNQLSDYMMQVQSYVSREQDLGNRAQYTPYNPTETTEAYSRENVMAAYQNELNADYFITLFVVGEFTVILSSMAPIAYMTRLKPKDIMIGGA